MTAQPPPPTDNIFVPAGRASGGRDVEREIRDRSRRGVLHSTSRDDTGHTGSRSSLPPRAKRRPVLDSLHYHAHQTDLRIAEHYTDHRWRDRSCVRAVPPARLPGSRRGSRTASCTQSKSPARIRIDPNGTLSPVTPRSSAKRGESRILGRYWTGSASCKTKNDIRLHKDRGSNPSCTCEALARRCGVNEAPTGNKKRGRQETQQSPSGQSPPPGTTTWR